MRRATSSTSRGLTVVLTVACIAALLLTAGCSSRPLGEGGKPPAPEILVDYQRTGGVAGFDDHLVIFANGQAIYSRKEGSGIFNLSSQELGETRTLLDTADFTTLLSDYLAPTPGADYFSYAVTYKGKTVTTQTGGVPPALAPVIGQLDFLLAENS